MNVCFQVYGIPDPRMGEEVCASVIVKEGEIFTEADVKAFCRGKVCNELRFIFP